MDARGTGGPVAGRGVGRWTRGGRGAPPVRDGRDQRQQHPGTRIGGPVQPDELTQWLQRRPHDGQPSGGAGLIPVTQDERGVLWALVLVEQRAGETVSRPSGTLYYNWLAGKRQAPEVPWPPQSQTDAEAIAALDRAQAELPGETAWREATEESFEVSGHLLRPAAYSAAALTTSGYTVWSSRSKHFLFVCAVPWSTDLVQRTRDLFAQGRERHMAAAEAVGNTWEPVEGRDVQWHRIDTLGHLGLNVRGGVPGAGMPPIHRSGFWDTLDKEGLFHGLDRIARHVWDTYGRFLSRVRLRQQPQAAVPAPSAPAPAAAGAAGTNTNNDDGDAAIVTALGNLNLTVGALP
jgi:hypothetical protein